MATNYDNIGDKSVWDLYVENFRNDLWDLAPQITWDEKGIRVVSSPWDEEESVKESSEEVKPKKAKRKSKRKVSVGMTKTGRVGDKPVDGLTQPPVKIEVEV